MKKTGLADSPFFQQQSLGGTDSPAPAEEKQVAGPGQKQSEMPIPSQTTDIVDTEAEAKASERFKVRDETNDRESKLASKQASKQISKLASLQASKQTSLQGSMQAMLGEKAINAATFRYPAELLEDLEDTLHVIRKKHRRKLTKNEIAVAALLFLLSDFETYGQESVLYQLLIEQPE